jgi:hypothetical protein
VSNFVAAGPAHSSGFWGSGAVAGEEETGLAILEVTRRVLEGREGLAIELWELELELETRVAGLRCAMPRCVIDKVEHARHATRAICMAFVCASRAKDESCMTGRQLRWRFGCS